MVGSSPRRRADRAARRDAGRAALARALGDRARAAARSAGRRRSRRPAARRRRVRDRDPGELGHPRAGDAAPAPHLHLLAQADRRAGRRHAGRRRLPRRAPVRSAGAGRWPRWRRCSSPGRSRSSRCAAGSTRRRRAPRRHRRAARAASRWCGGHRALRDLATASFVFHALQICLNTFLVAYLVSEHGLSLAAAGLALAVAQFGGFVGRLGFWLIVGPRFGVMTLLIWIGFGMTAAALATGLAAGLLAHAGALGALLPLRADRQRVERRLPRRDRAPGARRRDRARHRRRDDHVLRRPDPRSARVQRRRGRGDAWAPATCCSPRGRSSGRWCCGARGAPPRSGGPGGAGRADQPVGDPDRERTRHDRDRNRTRGARRELRRRTAVHPAGDLLSDAFHVRSLRGFAFVPDSSPMVRARLRRANTPVVLVRGIA